MKKHMKYISALLLLGMLTGCGRQEDGVINNVYAAIEAMSYEEALVQLEAIEPERGNRQELARLSGICSMGLGDYVTAAEQFEKALSYNSGFIGNVDYDINQYLAVAYFELGQYENAEHVYAAITALQPQNAEAHYQHGITLLEMGDYEAARTAFDQAVALEPTAYDRIIGIYKALYKAGYPALGVEYVEGAMKAQSNISDYDKGRMLYHIGSYNEAVSALEKVDKKKYEDAALYLGMSYEAMGDYNYAASVYSLGTENSTNPALYNQLGLCQMKIGAYAEALEAFQKGMQCEDVTYTQSLRFNEAIAYEYLADFETAKKLMAAYLKDYPNDKTAQREYDFLKTR